MAETQKAYSVLERDEWTGGIVFASRKDQAIRRATARYFDGEEPETSCTRAAWADVHAGGPVPAAGMVEHGWRFECSGCSRTIDADMHDLDGDPEEATGGRYRDWTPAAIVGTQDSAVYCTARCQEEDRIEKEKNRRMRNRAVARFTRILLARLPDAHPVDVDAYGGRPGAEFRSDGGVPLLQSVTVPFSFPGSHYGYAAIQYSPRGFRTDRKISYVCPSGDAEAFDAFIATQERNGAHAR
jgi:hypothetical protein